MIADPSERSYPLLSKTINILNGQSLDESAIIDNSLGRDSQFIFDYSENQGTIIYGEMNWLLHRVVKNVTYTFTYQQNIYLSCKDLHC